MSKGLAFVIMGFVSKVNVVQAKVRVLLHVPLSAVFKTVHMFLLPVHLGNQVHHVLDMDTTRECRCFEGYGGIGCSYCLPGWTLSYNESCIKLPDATTLANMFSSISTSTKLSLPPQRSKPKVMCTKGVKG